ncbi:MutS-related protein [Castellaniella caeni]|uniref:MutS-related protein n=1 Tax=Castellaniella caeni TaxID=266123 RepID=UPI0015E111B8|nr:DNA mismatch repair protein MutS [Castellaniella caeni]
MKVLLMHEDRDFDPQATLPAQADTLTQDLELDTLFDAMADGDEFLRDVARSAILQSLASAKEIVRRQQALRDCEQHRPAIDMLYKLAVDTLEEERKQMHFWFHNSASGTLSEGIGVLTRCHERLRALRQIADAQRQAGFQSLAFVELFEALHTQLDDAYLAEIARHLEELRFKYGTYASAQLGDGNKSFDWVLHRVPQERRGFWNHWLMHQPEIHAFDIAPRDEAGGNALEAVRNRALDVAAQAVGQAARQVLAFFSQLRIELAFYQGALNLKDALQAHGMTMCYPEPSASAGHSYEAKDLYDPCLCLTKQAAVSGNDVAARGIDLIFVTGANQGGKSTFLRSMGVAQLLLQAGLYAPAKTLAADPCSGLFTHYKREEDTHMESGKFDEELVRMDAIVDHITPGGMMLFNESFAATNEHEGADIAAEIIKVLLEKRVKVVFVTHFYELPLHFATPAHDNILFLAAERAEDGTRSHRIRPGEPSRTAYGRDLYARIFEKSATPTVYRPHGPTRPAS